MSDPKIAYKRMFMLLMLALSIAGLGVSLFSNIVLRYMAAKAYWSASIAVPFLVVAATAKALTLFCDFGIYLKAKTWVVAAGTYINAVVITISFLLLIKHFGFIGAAVGTMFGAILNLLWVEVRARKHYDMQLPWRRALLMISAWIACYVVSNALPADIVLQLLGKLIISIIFLVLVFVSPILDKDEKTNIIAYATEAYAKARARLKF